MLSANRSRDRFRRGFPVIASTDLRYGSCQARANTVDGSRLFRNDALESKNYCGSDLKHNELASPPYRFAGNHTTIPGITTTKHNVAHWSSSGKMRAARRR